MPATTLLKDPTSKLSKLLPLEYFLDCCSSRKYTAEPGTFLSSVGVRPFHRARTPSLRMIEVLSENTLNLFPTDCCGCCKRVFRTSRGCRAVQATRAETAPFLRVCNLESAEEGDDIDDEKN